MSERSGELDDIISSRPGFFERWGLWIFLIIVVALGSSAALIRYPDVVEAGAFLTATNAPKELVPRSGGRLVRLLAHNDDTVSAGAPVGWLESTAAPEEVLRLDTLLGACMRLMAGDRTEKASALFKMPFLRLGEVQAGYQQFVQAYQQFNDYLVNGYYIRRKLSMLADLDYLRRSHTALEEQQSLTRRDLALSQETFNADTSLFREKVISRQDMRDEESKLVGKHLSLPQLSASLLSNETEQVDKEREIAELEHSIGQQKAIFQEAVQTLKSQTEDWIRKYVLTAPVSGRVVFIVPLQTDQYIQEGRTVGYIDPPDSRYYAQVNLGQTNLGKVSVGEKVQLRIDAYPYQEFGYLEGRLAYISKVPSDSGFLANIELTRGLTTRYGNLIQYKSGLRGTALIITKEMRLGQRFYHSIVKATSR